MYVPLVQWPMSVCSAAAVFLNGLLIPIIIFRSVRVVGVYRILLLSYTCVGFATSVSVFVSLPILLVGRCGGIFTSTVVRFNVLTSRIMTPIYSIGYILWALILSYSFLFRCLVIRRTERILFSPLRKYLLLFFTIIVGVIYCFIDYGIKPEEEMLICIRDHLQNLTGERIEDLTAIGGIFFSSDDGFGRGFYICLAYVITIVPCFCCCAYCTLYFYLTRRNLNFSPMVNELHQRLFQLLVLQTITPCVFAYAPALISYLFAYASSDPPDFVQLALSSLLPVAQLIDPIWIFIFVKDYRNLWYQQPRRTENVFPMTSSTR